jgi:hypothetical protein
MTALTLTLTTLGLRTPDRVASDAGSVDYSRTASVTSRQDLDIRCTSGHLWVTLEGDRNDFVLEPGDCLHVAGHRKVVIGGKGAYRVNAQAPLAMAS